MEENKIKHLEFIQNIITRMNTNSFQIKGMAITIVSALIAIYASTSNVVFIFIGIFPTILFWFLDAYYLQQEKKFRGVYDNVLGIRKDVEVQSFEMPIDKMKGQEYCFCNAFWKKTIVWLYGSIIFCLIISAILLQLSECVIIIKCK